MDELTDPATERLCGALGLDLVARSEVAGRATRRDHENAALAAWAAAVADHDRALRERDEAVRRGRAAIRQAMRRLTPSYYQRIETCLDAKDWTALARFDGRKVARVTASRDEVRAARDRLTNAIAAAERAVEVTAAARRAAIEDLFAVFGLGRAVVVTGLGRSRLSAIRVGR